MASRIKSTELQIAWAPTPPELVERVGEGIMELFDWLEDLAKDEKSMAEDKG